MVACKEIPENEVQYSIEAMPDDMPVRGNAMVSGDDDLDKGAEDAILARLDSGDIWAWCTVKVTAKWKGLEGVSYLGGCSYAGEEQFKEDLYYECLKNEAFEDLGLIWENLHK